MEEEKILKKQKKEYVLILIICVILATLITANVTYKLLTAGTISISPDYELESKIANFKKIIENYYLGEVDEEELTQGALKGYIEGLGDEYSQYFTKEELEAYKADTIGNFVGIGIYMVKNEAQNAIMVLTPIEESPAAKAGIEPGDIIKTINGKIYTADEMDQAANDIKGEPGTKVSLEIERNGEIKSFEIERNSIKVYHIASEVLNNNIGYLKLNAFDDGAGEEFKTKYEELKAKNIKGLIIDLRNNGGGLVNEALEIADYMTEKDSVLLITTDKNNKEEISKAKEDKLVDVPVIVLVNQNSASASELLAGALKDNNQAKLVGVTTYGKGVIQELLTLTDGSGLKITTNEYYTPNRNKINKIGIEPDEVVELPEELKNKLTIEKEEDLQLQKAIELLSVKGDGSL